MSQSRVEAKGIALFVDLENLVGVAFTSGLRVDLEPVVTKLKEYGPVRLRKAYGDLPKTVESSNRGERGPKELQEIRRMLHRNLFEIVDIPFLTAHKNTTDVHLVLDAISLAFTNEGISHYAILSSDRDYVPLYNKLRELGKTVMAIAVDPQLTNSGMLREASDTLLYYSHILSPPVVSTAPSGEQPLDMGPALLDEYHGLLRRAVNALEKRGRKLVGTEVYQMMSQLQSDFDPEMVGCRNFKELVLKLKAERGLQVDIPVGAGDLVFHPLGELATTTPVHPPVMPPAAVLRKGEAPDVAWLRREIDLIMKIPFPNSAKRQKVLKAIKANYESLVKDGPFLLTELTKRTYDQLRKDGVDEATIYKMGLSLHFSRCFQCSSGQGQNNPEIVGLARPEEDWEERIFVNLVRYVHKNSRRVPTAEELAEILFEKDAPRRLAVCAKVLQDAMD